MHRILLVIPARGGSKGVVKKNLRLLDSIPIVARSILEAKKSGVFETIAVSTDDAEIAEVGEKYGAVVIWRPQELAADSSPTEPVMIHTLEELELKGNVYEWISLIQCTSPFLDSKTIRGVAAVTNADFDTCLTVAPMPHGIQFEWKKDSTNVFHPKYDLFSRSPRQMEKERFLENGAMYITRTTLFKKTQNRCGGDAAKTTAVLMSALDSMQIDTEDDMWFAEEIIKFKKAQGMSGLAK